MSQLPEDLTPVRGYAALPGAVLSNLRQLNHRNEAGRKISSAVFEAFEPKDHNKPHDKIAREAIYALATIKDVLENNWDPTVGRLALEVMEAICPSETAKLIGQMNVRPVQVNHNSMARRVDDGRHILAGPFTRHLETVLAAPDVQDKGYSAHGSALERAEIFINSGLEHEAKRRLSRVLLEYTDRCASEPAKVADYINVIKAGTLGIKSAVTHPDREEFGEPLKQIAMREFFTMPHVATRAAMQANLAYAPGSPGEVETAVMAGNAFRQAHVALDNGTAIDGIYDRSSTSIVNFVTQDFDFRGTGTRHLIGALAGADLIQVYDDEEQLSHYGVKPAQGDRPRLSDVPGLGIGHRRVARAAESHKAALNERGITIMRGHISGQESFRYEDPKPEPTTRITATHSFRPRPRTPAPSF